jgi:hypothetical protein
MKNERLAGTKPGDVGLSGYPVTGGELATRQESSVIRIELSLNALKDQRIADTDIRRIVSTNEPTN